MTASTEPCFLFAACNPGAENTLKRELARGYPHLRFAFSRPGFLTFKWDEVDGPAASWRLRSVFARTHGWSLGLVPDLGDATVAAVVNERFAAQKQAGQAFHRLHVWQRALVEQPDGVPTVVREEVVARAETFRAALVEAGCLLPQAAINEAASAGERVCDLIQLDDDRWALGWHAADSFEQRWPGGVLPLKAPAGMVSRAYLKMREALTWSALPMVPGDRCVEIGSSPGGACQALLEDGMRVTGVDPAPMHPQVLAHPRFTHIKKRGAEVKRREYAGFRWLFADANVAPRYTLDTVESIVQNQHTSIEGMVLTLKLMDWRLADHMAEYAFRVRSWGFQEVRCRQLACNHQEVCLAAQRAKPEPMPKVAAARSSEG